MVLRVAGMSGDCCVVSRMAASNSDGQFKSVFVLAAARVLDV